MSSLSLSLSTHTPFQSIPLLQTLSTPTSPTILCMEIEEESACNGIKRNKPLALDWEELLRTASADDDRPPELVVTSEKKSKDGGSGGDAEQDQQEHLELLSKSDLEIKEFIARHKKLMRALSAKLPDKGERLKAIFRRHEEELERRKKLQSEKGHDGREETVQLSDHSDDGACGKKKGDQKPLSSSTFAKLFCNRLEKDKDSRTVNAFEDDLSFINPCQGRKAKPNSQLLGKRRSRMGLSSRPGSRQEPLRSPRTPFVDSEKPAISDDDKKDNKCATSSPDHLAGNKPCSFSEIARFTPCGAYTFNLTEEEWQAEATLSKFADKLRNAPLLYPLLCKQVFDGVTATGNGSWGSWSNLPNPSRVANVANPPLVVDDESLHTTQGPLVSDHAPASSTQECSSRSQARKRKANQPLVREEELVHVVTHVKNIFDKPSEDDDIDACISKLERLGWEDSQLYDITLFLFSKSVEYRKIWLRLKDERCKSWIEFTAHQLKLDQ